MATCVAATAEARQLRLTILQSLCTHPLIQQRVQRANADPQVVGPVVLAEGRTLLVEEGGGGQGFVADQVGQRHVKRQERCAVEVIAFLRVACARRRLAHDGVEPTHMLEGSEAIGGRGLLFPLGSRAFLGKESLRRLGRFDYRIHVACEDVTPRFCAERRRQCVG